MERTGGAPTNTLREAALYLAEFSQGNVYGLWMAPTPTPLTSSANGRALFVSSCRRWRLRARMLLSIKLDASCWLLRHFRPCIPRAGSRRGFHRRHRLADSCRCNQRRKESISQSDCIPTPLRRRS